MTRIVYIEWGCDVGTSCCGAAAAIDQITSEWYCKDCGQEVMPESVDDGDPDPRVVRDDLASRINQYQRYLTRFPTTEPQSGKEHVERFKVMADLERLKRRHHAAETEIERRLA